MRPYARPRPWGAIKLSWRALSPAVAGILKSERVPVPGRFLFLTTDPVPIEIDQVESFNDDPEREVLKAGALKK